MGGRVVTRGLSRQFEKKERRWNLDFAILLFAILLAIFDFAIASGWFFFFSFFFFFSWFLARV